MKPRSFLDGDKTFHSKHTLVRKMYSQNFFKLEFNSKIHVKFRVELSRDDAFEKQFKHIAKAINVKWFIHTKYIICSRLSDRTANKWVRHPLLPTVWSQSNRTVEFSQNFNVEYLENLESVLTMPETNFKLFLKINIQGFCDKEILHIF